MSARMLPDVPAQPEHATDATGVITGNADLAGTCEWQPTEGPHEVAPLPGHEHQLDAEAAPKVWPWLTERRAFALSWACALGALALRLGDLA